MPQSGHDLQEARFQDKMLRPEMNCSAFTTEILDFGLKIGFNWEFRLF